MMTSDILNVRCQSFRVVMNDFKCLSWLVLVSFILCRSGMIPSNVALFICCNDAVTSGISINLLFIEVGNVQSMKRGCSAEGNVGHSWFENLLQ